MNGKQAKRLRKAAQQLTVAMPEVKYHGLKSRQTGGVQCILANDCTRKVYKQLKSRFKNTLPSVRHLFDPMRD